MFDEVLNLVWAILIVQAYKTQFAARIGKAVDATRESLLTVLRPDLFSED